VGEKEISVIDVVALTKAIATKVAPTVMASAGFITLSGRRNKDIQDNQDKKNPRIYP
jgi:hypothetical protein